jgi:hypothetical protein
MKFNLRNWFTQLWRLAIQNLQSRRKLQFESEGNQLAEFTLNWGYSYPINVSTD